MLESSQRDDSNKWSNIGFGEEITHAELINVKFTHPFWSSEFEVKSMLKPIATTTNMGRVVKIRQCLEWFGGFTK